MNIKGLAFDDGKITSYLFSLAGKKILFDFGSNDISDDQLQTIDYVFISHYHYDHICGLLNRMHYFLYKIHLSLMGRFQYLLHLR